MIYGISNVKNSQLIYTNARKYIDLPEPITALLDRQRELQQSPENAPEKPQSEAQMLVQGYTPDEAEKAHEDYEKALEKHRQRMKTRTDALQLALQQLPKLEVEHGHSIIEGPLRERTAELVSQAREHMAVLRPFWPADDAPVTAGQPENWVKPSGFDVDTILRKASPEQVTAYQTLVPLSVEFEALAVLYKHLLRVFNSHVKSGSRGSEYKPYVPQFVGGDVVFSNPDAVRAEWIKGEPHSYQQAGKNPVQGHAASFHLMTLGTVSEDAGFRLASLRELKDERDRKEYERRRDNGELFQSRAARAMMW